MPCTVISHPIVLWVVDEPALFDNPKPPQFEAHGNSEDFRSRRVRDFDELSYGTPQEHSDRSLFC